MAKSKSRIKIFFEFFMVGYGETLLPFSKSHGMNAMKNVETYEFLI